MGNFWRWLWCQRNYVIIIFTPLIFLPLPIVVPTSEAKCGYAIIVMALYWCTECMPLAVTALLPVVFFPLMGIMQAEQVSVQYLKDTNMLFIGGLLVAIAVENWNLHKRIALGVLLLVGVRPALLMMGFMGVTAFLSMWISNTATTAMMLPIAQAVLAQLSVTEAEGDERELRGGTSNQAFEMEDVRDRKAPMEDFNKAHTDVEQGVDQALEDRRKAREQKYTLLGKGMSLCVCYSASIGGTATLTGTTPNLILQGQLNSIYPDNNGIINFASWFGFAFPNMLLMLVFSWMWLQFMYLGFNLKKSFGCGTKDKGDKEAYQVMRDEYKKLGRISFAEGSVLVIFILLVVLWFTREPGFMPGWASALLKGTGFVSDGTVAIFMSALFFVIPSKWPFTFSEENDTDNSGNRDDDSSSDNDSDEEDKKNKKRKSEKKSKKSAGKMKAPVPLLTWDVVHQRMPWNIILLLGGGFALASGSEASGLSKWLGESLAPLQSIPPFAISLLLCLLVGTFTECSSNTATTTLFLPILASMATAIKLHPLYVMLPCTISASLAFMLPVATPPNAIAFSYGNLRVIDMAKAGCVLNVIGILTINLGINTWGKAMFHLDTFPTWAYNTSTPAI
ncbi:hypothetical protein AALO_G00030500 [Alosa alosa]|uniref:Solute carrier family 13 member 2 n=1 Tax=Alosa alosa TaxID=278164 RepID=A0AAV6HFY4_9TELE|nr:solute carrier family 13 member 2 [Alosa alosa]KAG5284787.1 hypothetical protein AALO_G00030500 [Alosa alosa]